MNLLLRGIQGCLLSTALVTPLLAQGTVSAPISNVRYDITFDAAAAQAHLLKVSMAFDIAGPGPVLLSLPVWTPGAYEVTDFAKWVAAFDPRSGEKPLHWDKLDYDTWRILPAGARSMIVNFDFVADTLDNAMTWHGKDFALFNGTNVMLYPEGRSLLFPATVRIHTEPGWLVATGMHPAGETGAYREKNYHDLVDMPFFIGRFDYDSTEVNGHWMRLATYPVGELTGEARAAVWKDIVRMPGQESAVFQDTPWESYSTMMIFDSSFGGGSALEHQDSHVGVYTTGLIGNPVLASITAHEMFHSWNVKRLRPSEMVPYRYDRSQPTPWLWVSEGITDYYADLTTVRGGIVDSAAFLAVTEGKITQVNQTVPVALEDASLSTWIHPVDGTGYLYYPKGSLAGLMLDIMIRDGSNNRRSLDDVMRELYRSTYKLGKGFTSAQWWGAVQRASGIKSFAEFNAKYVDGRDAYPWDRILPLAGLRLITDTTQQARVGLSSAGLTDSGGVRITQVLPGSMAEAAGVQVGDVLLSLGEVKVTENDFGPAYRSFYNSRPDESIDLVVRRGADTLKLPAKVRVVPEVEQRLQLDPDAGEKAVRIRSGILHGTVDR